MTQALRIAYLPRPARLFHFVSSHLRPPDIATGEVRELLSEYGLELIGAPQNLLTSRRNHNVVVDTPAGKKMLKAYRPQWQVETVTYGHSILARLAELDFPAPRVVTALNGDTFIQRARRNYVLFDFVQGTNYSMNFLLRAYRRTLMGMAGQILARLHQQLRGFLPHGQHHIGFEAYTGKRRRDFAWHTAKVNELKYKSRGLTKPEERQHAAWLIQNSNYILHEFGRLDEALGAVPLPRVIIHGDYGLHNLLFRSDGTVTPVDFELSRLEWRLSDLVSCLSRFRYGGGDYDFESIQWFMAGYHAEYPISAEEWSLFPKVWRFYKIQSAIQYWNSYFETNGPVRKLASARDAMGQADWAQNHPDQLVEQIRGQHLRWSLA